MLGLDFAHLVGDHLGIRLAELTLPGGSVVVGAAVAGGVAVDDAEAAAAAAVETCTKKIVQKENVIQ